MNEELDALAYRGRQVAVRMLMKIKKQRKYLPKTNFTSEEISLLQAVLDLEKSARHLQSLVKAKDGANT